MNNQFFKENIFCINKIKDILKSKDINENLFVDEENYFIKTNSLIHHYETKNSDEKYIEENNIKKAKKKQAKEKIFLIEKIDKKKKNMGRRKKEKKYKTKASHNKFNKDS